jgi:DNA polymerase III epsilon subunit-like protein
MYLFFDTETNGLPLDWKAPVTNLSNWPRLVQIAWVLFDYDGNEIHRNDDIIKPVGFTIPKEASLIHGITTERALDEGIDLGLSLREFNEQISKATNLVAHNMSFDEKILGAEFLRSGYSNPIPYKNRICTMKSTTDYCAIEGYYGYKWPKLSELHIKLFGHDFEEAHDAAADIDATARCFWELRNRKLI